MGTKNKVEVITGDPAPKRRYEIKYKTKDVNGEVWAYGTLQVFSRSQEEAEEFARSIIKDSTVDAYLDGCCDITDRCEGL